MSTVGAQLPKDADDWALIRQIGTGDQAALATLYERYYGYLFRFVQRVTRRPELCEEVINDVMYTVWQKAADTRQLSRASTWILGIAYNKALKAAERQRRYPGESVSADELESVAIADIADQISTDSLADKALALLPPEQRAVMELVYFHGLHYQDIASVLNCPENTVKTRMFHARKRLRGQWPALTGESAPAATAAGGIAVKEVDL